MLKIANLKKHFGGIKAVDDCSFEIKENTITALIGPNGAGKSTVFNLISGLLKVDSGTIKFKNKKINNLSPEKVSNLGISRLFQQTKLFNNLTVKDNLLLAIDNNDTKFWSSFVKTSDDKKKFNQIKEILELVGMSGSGGENKLARDLSYGQKRLVELARTILNPHNFLMLDEPVAGVNPKLRQKIADILVKLKKQGETILLIEHDMNFTLKISDWVIVMDEGKVIAEAKPEEIRNNPKVLEAYLG
ncbi:ABC transporter ATP-binding protein [Patescibacteria group bacterium]|nr:ABC transporter ATP-binding protein [Patescibacteria group bacterium]